MSSANNNKQGWSHQYGYPLPRPLQPHRSFVDYGVGHGQSNNQHQAPPRPPAPAGANCQGGVCTPSSRYPCGFRNFH
uniref:Uncharacterized protein n=1 Tax=viral metagenome TaxID=1070528 RepID=A0A6C0K1M5_9ZZZZ